MKNLNVLLTLLLFSNIALSYQDMDIDGVDDSVDWCPNTPFDELVDEFGCSKSQKPSKSYGHFTVKLGTDFFTDSEYEDDSSFNMYFNYRYNTWDISVSNFHSISSGSYSGDNSYSDNDVYVSLGKSFNIKRGVIKLSIGTKIVGDVDKNKAQKYIGLGRGRGRKYKNIEASQYNNTNNGNGINTQMVDNETIDDNRNNDYFGAINLNYLLNHKQNIYINYRYTLSGDSNTMDYEDYSSFLVGMGYMLTQNLYGELSYNYTGSIYKDIGGAENITLFGNYNFTKNIFASVGYSYAIDDLSYDNTLSLAVGFTY